MAGLHPMSPQPPQPVHTSIPVSTGMSQLQQLPLHVAAAVPDFLEAPGISPRRPAALPQFPQQQIVQILEPGQLQPQLPTQAPLPQVLPQIDETSALYGIVKNKLTWFYKRFNPSKVPLIDRILRERGGVGMASDIFKELCTRYAEGHYYLSVYDTLETFYSSHNKEKAALVGAVMEEWSGREDKLMRTLEKKYNSSFFRDRGLLLMPFAARQAAENIQEEQDSLLTKTEAFLHAVYKAHCQQMLPFIPTLMVIYKDRCGELVTAVSTKFSIPVPPDLLALVNRHTALPNVPLPSDMNADLLSGMMGGLSIDAPILAEQEARAVLDEKDALIAAQMKLIEDYAMQLDQRREEANTHEQTVSYLRQLHVRANTVIQKFGRHIKQMSEQYPADEGQMPVAELGKLCNILGVDEAQQQQQQQQQQLQQLQQQQQQHQQQLQLQLQLQSQAQQVHYQSQYQQQVPGQWPGLSPYPDMYPPCDDDESLPPSPVNKKSEVLA